MKVYHLLKELAKFPSDTEVQVWLPGSRVELSAVFIHGDGTLLIEGNVKEGSALGHNPASKRTLEVLRSSANALDYLIRGADEADPSLNKARESLGAVRDEIAKSSSYVKEGDTLDDTDHKVDFQYHRQGYD